MVQERIDGTPLSLPSPPDIPIPAIADALTRVVQLHTAQQRAWQEWDVARADARDAGNRDRVRLGDAYFENPAAFDENPSAELEAAQKASTDAHSRLKGMLAAESKAVSVLRETIAEHADEWAAAQRRSAAKAVTKLATATRMAQAARKELQDSIGVLHMLDQGEQLTVRHIPHGYTFALNPAVDNLQTALALVTDELGALK